MHKKIISSLYIFFQVNLQRTVLGVMLIIFYSMGMIIPQAFESSQLTQIVEPSLAVCGNLWKVVGLKMVGTEIV